MGHMLAQQLGSLQAVPTMLFQLPKSPRTPTNVLLFQRLFCKYHCPNTVNFLVDGLKYCFGLGFTEAITPS